jgi:hypothetical protein
MLMPINYQRFSIDIDISTTESKTSLEQALHDMMPGSRFKSFIEITSRKSSKYIPKAHYEFSYITPDNQDDYVLLDAIFEENPFIEIIEVNIANNLISSSEPYPLVKIPSVNSVLGDKLTAFAPTTTGIPYWLGNPNVPDKRLEIIKQLYDISLLIEQCTDINETRDVFEEIAMRQIEYRQLDIGLSEVTEDIFFTALTLAKRERNKEEPNVSWFRDLQQGLVNFAPFMILGTFRIENAIAASAKIACFTQNFISGRQPHFEPFGRKSNIEEWNIKNPDYNFLNRFKKTNPEAFYYWHKCLEFKNIL